MQGARIAATGMYIEVHEDCDNPVAAQANLRPAEVKRSGRSQYRATPQPPSAAIFRQLIRSCPGSAR
jgi:hypothetical protein